MEFRILGPLEVADGDVLVELGGARQRALLAVGLVCVTLLGAGASRANCSLIYLVLILRVLAPMLPDKEAQEQVATASDLDWVLVRPPRFTGGDAGGNLRLLREGQPGRVGHVVRADLARFLVECATGAEYSCEALAVGS